MLRRLFVLFVFLFFSIQNNAQEILRNGLTTASCTNPPPSPACDLIDLFIDDFPVFDITSLTATGGSTPYTWGITGLPAGLEFSASGADNENLTITGAPESAGNSVITVTLTDNATNTDVKSFNLEVRSGRRPVSVVLVLDRSGSMRWELGSDNPVAAPNRRWDDVIVGGGLFGTEFAAPGIQTTGDQLGVVYFESVADTDIASGANFTNGFFNQPFETIDTELSGETPGGWTSMGEGLLRARIMLESSDVPIENRKVILLFTDGEQNRGRIVQAVDGKSIIDLDGPVDGDLPPENINPADEIEIYPIAVFGPGGYLSILQNIADFNNDEGVYLFTSGGTDPDGAGNLFQDIAVFFVSSLNTILQNSSPQLIERREGNFDNQNFAEEKFIVNDSISQLYFYTLSSDTLSIDIEIEKDGIEISPSKVSRGERYAFYTIDFTGESDTDGELKPKGEWTVRIFGRRGSGERNNSYKIGAIANDHFLNLNYDVQSTYHVEDPISTTISLDYKGTAIKDAETVLWTILKPGDDIGDLLARTASNLDSSSAQDAGSTGLQKYFDLLENDPEFIEALSANEQLIPLANNGDGTYSGSFTNTDVTGVYQMIYFIKGEHPNIGTYIRTNFRSVVFRFDTVDNDISAPSAQITDNGVTLSYRPAYNVGGKVRFVGPAFGKDIKVKGDDIKVKQIIDNGDGSYVIELIGNPDANITISLLDTQVYKGKASSFGKSPSTFDDLQEWFEHTFGIPFWLGILILILLILLIIWLIKKIKK